MRFLAVGMMPRRTIWFGLMVVAYHTSTAICRKRRTFSSMNLGLLVNMM